MDQYKQKNDVNLLKINEILKKVENRINKIEVKLSEKQVTDAKSVDESLIKYLRDLKSIIIPAMQKKLIDSENQLLDFIKQMTAKLKTDQLIKDELEKNENL